MIYDCIYFGILVCPEKFWYVGKIFWDELPLPPPVANISGNNFSKSAPRN
jgi:hypothetical protein